LRINLSAPGELPVLFHHRWTVPVLAELDRERGAKTVTLIARLGVSRGALMTTLEHAAARGWVMRNPGYGHPLRPEWVLTPAGEALSPSSARLWRVLRERDLTDVGLRKWTVPALMAMRVAPARFGDLRDALAGVTDRALSQTLKRLYARELIELSASSRVSRLGSIDGYRPTALGRRLIRPLSADRT
jgi:DNA-binding HxlR family transcriptional regulator